jgi:DNA segregation ATPase FtsK/SpoIIIE-like protein
MKPYFLLCDEFIFLVEEVSTKKKQGEDQSDRDKLFAKLRDISLRGRAAGVFLILILQRPDSSFLPTVIRDNLMCKVVLGGSETAFNMAFGSEYKGLANLDLGQGYCLLDDIGTFSFPNYEQDEFMNDLAGKVGASAQVEGNKGNLVELQRKKADRSENEMVRSSSS